MKPEQIFEAITYTDEDLLLKSENGKGETLQTHRVIHWRRWGTLAACACLAVILISVTPLRGVLFVGTSSSSSSYDATGEMAVADAEDEMSKEAVTGSSTVSGETDNASAAAVEVVSDGISYRELTAEELADYGIDETEYSEKPVEEIGDLIGTIEAASEDALIGEEIYQLQEQEELYAVHTENEYRYFVKTE